MKRQYSVSITAGSDVADFLDGIGHKRGVVIEAILAQHLRDNNGYISPEAAIDAGYKFSDKDTDFAARYRGKSPPKIKNENAAYEKKPQKPKEQKKPEAKEEEKWEPQKQKESGFPEVKNKEMVMAGLSAFMT